MILETAGCISFSLWSRVLTLLGYCNIDAAEWNRTCGCNLKG